MSVSCALWATSLHQWARRYLRRTQPSRCNPEKRARMRAFFAEGVDNMHIPWAVEGLPTLLHLSLFLFFGGVAIFLFDVDREVFSFVIWWIGLFSMVHGLITLLPIIRHDSPYHSPLSTPAWFLYASIHYVPFKFLDYTDLDVIFNIYPLVGRLMHRYQGWMSRGVEMAAEEAVSERLLKIDVRILDWTITTLGDDDSLKNFFEAIPGFFNSNVVKHLEGNFPEELRNKYSDALNGFLDRTLSSNSVNDSEKLRRLDISVNAMNWMRSSDVLSILNKHRDQLPQTLEMGQSLARWCTSDNIGTAYYAKSIIARILASAQERDDRWITLASRAFGLTGQDLRENIALGDDSVLLAILIHVARQCLRSGYMQWMVLEALSKFDIRNTFPRLQHDFCSLWNEIVQEARKRGSYSTPVEILREIRQHCIALHQGTDAAPTAFSASTDFYDDILREPSSYPFCHIASHHPDSTPHVSVLLPSPGSSPDASSSSPPHGGNSPSRQAQQGNNVVEPPSSDPTTTDIGATAHVPDTTPPTNPVHSSSRPTGAFPTAVVAAALQDITSTATSSHSLEGSEQQDSDIVAPSAEPGTSQILSTASTHAPTQTLAPIPTSLPKSYDASVTLVSDSSHFAPPSIGPSIPASRPTGSATLPRLRARGLVNTGNICFANAVLHLLVNLPQFQNLFRELDDLKGQRGARIPETGGGPTRLVDATVRFFKEFIVQDESPSTQQQSLPATGGTSRAEEEMKDDNAVDSFEPTYMYDAMKEKRQLKPLLVRSRSHVAASY
jgi:hypothetical protein